MILPVDCRAVSKAKIELLAERLRAAVATAQIAPQKGKTHMTLDREIGRPDGLEHRSHRRLF